MAIDLKGRCEGEARGPDESGLHGVYPERYLEILPLRFTQGQNDIRRRVRNDNLCQFASLPRNDAELKQRAQ